MRALVVRPRSGTQRAHVVHIHGRIAAVIVDVAFAAGVEYEDIFVMAFNASNLI